MVDSPASALASGEQQFDVLLNTFRGPVSTESYDLVRRGGRLVTLTEPPDQSLATARGIEAIFFVVSSDRADLGKVASLADEGRLRPVIARTFPLAQAGAAYSPPPPPQKPGKTVLVVRP